jgi:alcohol dehydrogenase (cytochrome c)
VARTGHLRHGALRRNFSMSQRTTISVPFSPRGEVPKPDSAGFYVGYQVEDIFGSVRISTGAGDHLCELQAWDLNPGKRVWQHNFKTILWAPLLVTGGDIVFAGGTPDREFRAFDARTGDQL